MKFGAALSGLGNTNPGQRFCFFEVITMAVAVSSTATTVEGQFLDIARELQILEAAQSTDETPLNNVQLDTDIEAGTVTVSATLPITLGGSAGALTVTAAEYLS